MSSSTRISKYCCDCGEIRPWNEFYSSNPAYCIRHLNGRRGRYARNTQKPKGRGLFALPKVIQWAIKRDYKERKKITHISKFYKIKYGNILHWKKRGWLD